MLRLAAHTQMRNGSRSLDHSPAYPYSAVMRIVGVLLAILAVYLLGAALLRRVPEQQLPAAHQQCDVHSCPLDPPSNEIRFQREQQKQYLENHRSP